MNENAVRSLAVIIVLCLLVVVSSGLSWHIWHSWGHLIVAELVFIGIMGFLVRKVIKF
ncbi:MAG: hypothetical protein AB1487_10845 [Thermodesulfobacteriota bacterium]